MVLFDLADNTWMPLLIVGLVLVVGFGLFLNMRKQIGRVDIPEEEDPAAASPPSPLA